MAVFVSPPVSPTPPRAKPLPADPRTGEAMVADVGSVFQEAQRLHQQGQLQGAAELYERVLSRQPAHSDALHMLGVVAFQLGNAAAAVELIYKSVDGDPSRAAAHNNLGVALRAMKRLPEALASYDNAIALDPASADAHNNRGNVLCDLKRSTEALASFDVAIALKADYAEAHNNRGNVLKELRRIIEARESYDKALSIKPNYVEAHSNRGLVLQELNELHEALSSFEKAISLKADHAAAHSNRGNVLKELRQLSEALASYDKALAIEGDHAEARWNKALALLLMGDFQEGLPLYEWRWGTSHFESSVQRFAKPRWLGREDLLGKTILLHAEQGLGDTIQFCRYAKAVKRLGARVVLGVPAALREIVQGLEGVDVLLNQGDPLPEFDFHCPLLSLPLAFKTDLGAIPCDVPYLKSPPGLQAQWSHRLGAKKRIRVGLTWSGNPNYRGDRLRSMTLAELLPHLPNGCEYFCLQREIRQADKDLLLRSGIHFFGDELTFPHTAALIELMDVVVSTDTSIPHLAGALGKPTWLMLAFVPDWRWMLDRHDSPWYPTMRLFRQGPDRGWGPVLDTIEAELKRLTNGARPSTA